MRSTSYSAGLAISLFFIPFVLANPIPSPEPAPAARADNSNSYSGPGGSAGGGSVTSAEMPAGPTLLNIFSGNAGNGGDASSGDALANGAPGEGEPGKAPPMGGKTPKAKNGADSTDRNGLGPNNSDATTHNSFSGAGGKADGGGAVTGPSLVNLFSHNAGNGGQATSGSSGTGSRKYMNKNRFDAFKEPMVPSSLVPGRRIRVLRKHLPIE